MGCDIHFSMFVYSKAVKQFISINEIIGLSCLCDTYAIVGNRYYDLFGAFGNSARSSYPMMTTLHEGVPSHLLPKTTILSIQKDTDYHTYTWATLEELREGVCQYIDKLDNPSRFLLDDPENFSENMFEFPEWNISNTNLKDAFDKIKLKLNYIEGDLCLYADLIDPSKTIFLFYFDS